VKDVVLKKNLIKKTEEVAKKEAAEAKSKEVKRLRKRLRELKKED